MLHYNKDASLIDLLNEKFWDVVMTQNLQTEYIVLGNKGKLHQTCKEETLRWLP